MTQFYTDTSRQLDTYTLPNAEVFYVEEGEWYYDDNGDRHDAADFSDDTFEDSFKSLTACSEGYYYWYCLPGCMPDGEPMGPYETEEAAIAACREENEEG